LRGVRELKSSVICTSLLGDLLYERRTRAALMRCLVGAFGLITAAEVTHWEFEPNPTGVPLARQRVRVAACNCIKTSDGTVVTFANVRFVSRIQRHTVNAELRRCQVSNGKRVKNVHTVVDEGEAISFGNQFKTEVVNRAAKSSPSFDDRQPLIQLVYSETARK